MARRVKHFTVWCFLGALLCLIAVPALAQDGAKAEEKIPRILLVGDSWPMFLSTGFIFWKYEHGSAFTDVLADYRGGAYSRWIDVGPNTLVGVDTGRSAPTAQGMSLATQWSTNELCPDPETGEVVGHLELIRRELMRNPTVDIVHLCMGGNDGIRGDMRPFIDYEEFQMQTLTFTGVPTGGFFTLSFKGETTVAIPFNATASEIQAAMEALTTIGAGNIEVTEVSGGPSFFFWFKGHFSSESVPMIVSNGSALAGSDISMFGVQFDHGWKKAWGQNSPAELAFGQALLDQIGIVLEYILNVRPDIHVVFADYDYMEEGSGGADFVEANANMVRMGQAKLALCQLLEQDPRYAGRIFYLNTFGLQQWTYGYPLNFVLTSEVPDEIRSPVIPAGGQFYGPMGAAGTMGTILPPGTYPDYEPFAGGDPAYPSPAFSILFDFGKSLVVPEWLGDPKASNIHMHEAGYETYARYALDQFYAAWLDLPKVISVERCTPHPILPGQDYSPTGADQVAFRVRFTAAVTGVDETDFRPLMQEGLAGASIESVSEEKDGEAYTVIVNTGEGSGTLGLEILDNGTIEDSGGTPLGGPGNGNGYFAYGETYTIDPTISLPVAAWPLVPAMLGFAALMLRRRGR